MLVKDHATGKIVIRPSREAIRYYDAGKIKIGIAHVPRPKALNWDEEQLQSAILNREPIFKKRGWW
jgi:hypothetical protein